MERSSPGWGARPRARQMWTEIKTRLGYKAESQTDVDRSSLGWGARLTYTVPPCVTFSMQEEKLRFPRHLEQGRKVLYKWKVINMYSVNYVGNEHTLFAWHIKLAGPKHGAHLSCLKESKTTK